MIFLPLACFLPLGPEPEETPLDAPASNSVDPAEVTAWMPSRGVRDATPALEESERVDWGAHAEADRDCGEG